MTEKKRFHISHSQLKNWSICPAYHKLDKIDGLVPRKGSLYTAFGSAVHASAEYIFEGERRHDSEEVIKLPEYFSTKFHEELKNLEAEGEDLTNAKKMIDGMYVSGRHIVSHLVKAMTKRFGKDFKVLSIEEELKLPIPGAEDFDFLGYVDIVVESKGEIYICDWKTCSWGWSGGFKPNKAKQVFGSQCEEEWFPPTAPAKKSDKLVAYQLALYKHFWMQKNFPESDFKKVKTAFILLKRSPGKDDNKNLKNPVEFYEVSCGKIKVKNALTMLTDMAYNLRKGVYMKNRLSCQKFGGYSSCIFNNTKYCSRFGGKSGRQED
jgi:hypothetical protein